MIRHARELEAHKYHLEELIDLRTQELNLTNKKLIAEIAKEKEIEAKLEETLLKEKELNEHKSRFVSTISHEFRTPLTTVLSSAELMSRNINKLTEEKIVEYTTRIKNSVEYLTKLLNDVITLNKADSGKLKCEPSLVNLKEICNEVLETSLIYSKESHKIFFDYHLEKTDFLLDGKLLRIILSNLLVNAFKYSPNGGSVSFTVNHEKNNLVYKICDEGIGIPIEDKPYLFDAFHRGSNCEDIPGTGLGLSIVNKSIEIQNGTIEVESELDKGTRFTVKIPIY